MKNFHKFLFKNPALVTKKNVSVTQNSNRTIPYRCVISKLCATITHCATKKNHLKHNSRKLPDADSYRSVCACCNFSTLKHYKIIFIYKVCLICAMCKREARKKKSIHNDLFRGAQDLLWVFFLQNVTCFKHLWWKKCGCSSNRYINYSKR